MSRAVTPARWRQVSQLYHAALAREGDHAAFLEQACAGDEGLRREVESLLAQPAFAEAFLAEPAVALAAQLVSDPGPMQTGHRIGVYQVQALLGAGGMGEVYRARDTKLGREVAVKILPRAFTSDPERLARFEREARMLATLNHPHIGAIYGFEDADGIRALVLELVEGQTLAERMAKGPIPQEESLNIAGQIADALESAHEKGIIHRDLKPANIKITPDGIVKVLDFGLAKLGAGQDTADSPTVTVNGTREGVILGTAAYMSPEQARGKPVDKRSDIWAFGCVLYEMLTGRRAFEGENVTDTLAFILTKDPDWSAMPTQTPPPIRRLLRRLLTKDRNERLADIADARIELKDALAAPDAEVARTVEASRHSRERVVWASVATITTAAAIVLGMLYLRSVPTTVPAQIQLSVAPPQNVTFSASNGQTIPAVSPDGRQVAFVAREGRSLLWVRSLDSLEGQPLTGTDGAALPFWSPDSRALGFFEGGTLKTIDASGGPVRTLCDAPNARGGTWSPDGVIVFGSQSGGLSTVSASGGSPVPLTTLDAAREERAHRFPSFLPDGRHYLYWATPPNTILLGSLDSKDTTRLLTAESQAVYVAPGSLLFVRRGTLMAQPFDARRGTLTGEAVPIVEQVLADTIGGAAFAASSSGVLAYRTGTLGGPTQLTWVDRAGRPLGAVGPPGRYRNPELSRDGTRVAVEVVDPQGRTQDIWVVGLARGVASRVTFDPANDIYPVWSPDDTQIMFGSDRGGVFSLYQKRADGAGSEELVLKSNTDMVPYSWSPDGRVVVYRTTAVNGGTNLGILPLVGERLSTGSGRLEPAEGRTPHLFEASRFSQGTSQVSPDSRWLAYVSGESGRNEIYVQSFPSPGGGKVQISRDGSSFVRWRHDGRELFYYATDGRLMAIPVMGATALDVGVAVPLFEPHTLNGPTAAFGFRQQYDVARDGRFLLNLPVKDATPASITVVVNWTARVKK